MHTSEPMQELKSAISQALPYYKSPGSRQRNAFPESPGIYLILRKCDLAAKDYRYADINPKTPIVLYVGYTTARRTIHARLTDHFGKIRPNFQGSQFVKLLMQVIQDEAAVQRILCSPSTVIAAVSIKQDDQTLKTVARAAIEVFSPLFNRKASFDPTPEA